MAHSSSRLIPRQLYNPPFMIGSGKVWEYIFPFLAWIKCLPLKLGVGITPLWKTGPKSIKKNDQTVHRRKGEWTRSLNTWGGHRFCLCNSYLPSLPPLPQDPKADVKLTVPALWVYCVLPYVLFSLLTSWCTPRLDHRCFGFRMQLGIYICCLLVIQWLLLPQFLNITSENSVLQIVLFLAIVEVSGKHGTHHNN